MEHEVRSVRISSMGNWEKIAWSSFEGSVWNIGLDGGVKYGTFEGAFFRPVMAYDGYGGILAAQADM